MRPALRMQIERGLLGWAEPSLNADGASSALEEPFGAATLRVAHVVSFG